MIYQCSLLRSLLKSNQISELNPTGTNAEALLQAIQAYQQAMTAADTAVNAYAQAVATCQVNVSCGQAQNQLITAQSYQQTAASASSQSEKALGTASSAVERARSVVANLTNNNSDVEVNARAAKSAMDVTGFAVKQAQLASQASSAAVASCQVIINVVCNSCPQGASLGIPAGTNGLPSRAPNTGNVFADARSRTAV